MEVASTREHPPIHRRHVYPSAHFDHIGTDAKREHHGIRQGLSKIQSSAPREWIEAFSTTLLC